MKKIVSLFSMVVCLMGIAVAQLLPPVSSVAPDLEQDRASHWLTWSNNTSSYHMIGFDGTTQYYAMQRFTTSDLSPYNGQQLTKIRFLPSSVSSEPTSASYSVVVYTGGDYYGYPLLNDPGTQVRSQVVTDITYGSWKTVTLNSPLTINASEELWIGVYVTAYSGYAMSYDDGTAVADKGNLMGYDGEWGVPSDFFSNTSVTNWNIAGLVTDGVEETFIDLSVRFINNGTDQDDITSMNVPAGQPFRPVIVVRNESSAQATLDYTGITTVTGYMDNVQVSTHQLSAQTLESGHGVWLQASELSSQDVFEQGYCGTTHNFCYEVSSAPGWNDADLTNNRACITVTFGEYSNLYHITVLNEDSTISPSGVVDVIPNGNQRFVITPPEGMQIAQALADGVDVTSDIVSVFGVGKTYTFHNVQADHTFQVLYGVASVDDFSTPDVDVFPNPVGSQLNITSGKRVQKLSVYDCTGRVVKSSDIPSDRFEINVDDLHSGVYFVEIVVGKQIITKKFVKM